MLYLLRARATSDQPWHSRGSSRTFFLHRDASTTYYACKSVTGYTNNVVDITCALPLRAKIVFRPRDRLSGGVENRERVGVFPGPVFTSLSLIISEGLFLLICCYWYFRENLQKYIISWKMFLVTPCFPGKQILLNGVNMSLENPLPCPP